MAQFQAINLDTIEKTAFAFSANLQYMTPAQIAVANIGVSVTAGTLCALSNAQIAALTSNQIKQIIACGLQGVITHAGGPRAWSRTQFESLSADAIAPMVNRNPATDKAYTTKDVPLFSAGGPLIGDINQGGYGDCFFLAGLAGLAQNDPSFVESAIISDANGIYSVRFFDSSGQANWVTINSEVTSSAAGSFGNGWVAIVEKAYTVFCSLYQGKAYDYSAILYGGFSNGLQSLTGNTATKYEGASYGIRSTLETWRKSAASVKAALKLGEVVMYASYQETWGDNKKIDLFGPHMYTVTGFNDTTDKFILRNPWGSSFFSANTFFEESADVLYGSYDGAPGIFFVNNSVGASSDAGQLTHIGLFTQALASEGSSTILVSASTESLISPLAASTLTSMLAA